MIVTQDIRTTFDLAGNPTTIVFSDNSGKAYTETRTYARGYQLTNATITTETGVSSSTSGSYTYDTNNNLLTTKQIDVTRGSTQLAFRGNWTFTFDRKNRLKTHSLDGGTSYTELWYDALGRVFKRWTFDGDIWSENPMYFVYDSQQLMQEIQYEDGGEMGLVYSKTLHDYLRKPDGIRDKTDTGSQVYEDRYLLTDKGQITARVKRETTSAVVRQELTVSGERQSGGSTQDAQISNLGSVGGYIEGYGGGTDSENSEVYFDPLVGVGGRHYLNGLDMFLSRRGNNPHKADEPETPPFYPPTGPIPPPPEDWIKTDPYVWLFEDFLNTCFFAFTFTPITFGSGGWIFTPPIDVGDPYIGSPEPWPPHSSNEPPLQMWAHVECCCALEFETTFSKDHFVISNELHVFVNTCECIFSCDEYHTIAEMFRTIKETCPEHSVRPSRYENSICCDWYVNYVRINTVRSYFNLVGDYHGAGPWVDDCSSICNSLKSASPNFYDSDEFWPPSNKPKLPENVVYDVWMFRNNCLRNQHSTKRFTLERCESKE